MSSTTRLSGTVHPIWAKIPADFLSAKRTLRDKIFAQVPAIVPQAMALRKKKRFTSHLPANIVGIGVAEKISGGKRTGALCVTVFVAKKFPKKGIGRASLIPSAIDGIPTDVRAVGYPKRLANAHRSRQRPCPGGVSVGLDYNAVAYKFAGTLGGIFVDAENPSKRCMLSNNHVFADENRMPIGSGIVQPGTLDGGRNADRIGSLYRFVPLRFDNRRNWMDAAAGVFESNALANMAIVGLGMPTGVSKPELNSVVRKSGRTTGVTEGIIRAIPFDVINVQYETGMVRVDDVMVIESEQGSFSKAGDSGSLILDAKGRVVGLLFAGSDVVTYAIPIRRVLRQLRLKLET